MIAGRIEIQLMAGIARLQADMDRARRVVGDATSVMGRMAGIAGSALGAIGAALSIGSFVGWIKGAIDAGDAASKLSAKTGVAVEDLAGIQLAFDLGGAGGDAFASSMSKLSKAITEGNSGLAALGVKTAGANGSLVSNKEVLYQVADAFAKMEDGARKSAMAQEIFGKTGADLIPLLNGGADGFRQMEEMATKLGLTMSAGTAKSAEAFNDNLDLLMMGSQGVARGIAAELLPTLSSLSGAFLSSMTSGDNLKKVAEFLGYSLKVLFSIAVGIVEVFSTVGKTIGAAGAQIVAILNGDFKMAAQIGREWSKDIGDSWADTAKTISAAWSGEGDAAVEAQAKIMKAQKDLLAEQKAREEAAKKAAQERTAAAKKSQQEYESAVKAGNDFIASMKVEGSQLGMNAAQIKEMAAARSAAKAPTAALRAQILSEAAALAEATQAWALKDAAEKSAAAVDAELYASLAKTTAGIDDQITAMRKQIDAYGLTEVAVIDLAAAKAEAALASGPATYAELIALDTQISKLKELRLLAVEKGNLDVAKKAAEDAKDEWKTTAASIKGSLTDALMRGFESGKGFGRNLIDTIKNMFGTLVLRPIISAIVNPVAGAVTGMMGMSGSANAATSGAGSAIGSSLGITGTIGAVGAGAMQTAGAILTGQIGLGTTLSAGLSAIGTGTASGMAAGFSSVIGALGPIALGIGAAVLIWKKLDTSGTYHTGGASSASGAGVQSVRAESLNFERTQVNAETEKMTAALASGIVGILDSTATAFGKTAGYTAATAFADDTSKDGAWGGLVISKLGQTILDWQDTKTGSWAPKVFADGDAGKAEYLAALSASVRTALDGIGLPAWAQTMLDKVGDGASIEELGKVVESINATQRVLVVLGDKLVGFAGLSEGAVSSLIAASGGIDALAASASSYYDTYYLEAEKTADITKQVTDALAAVGLAMPASQAAFRAQVEAQMALGEAGAPAVAALLKVNQAFAQLNPALAEVAAATESAADALAAAEAIRKEQRGLDIQLMTALGDAEGALAATRSDALAGMLTDQARITQAQIWAADEAAQAASVAKAASEEFALSMKTAADALSSRNSGIQQQIDFLVNASLSLAERRALETTGMDASTLALQERLYALTDEASAITAAAAAQKDLSDTLKASTADALAALGKSIAAEKASIGVIRDVASESVRSITGIFDLLKDQVSQLYGTVDSTSAMQAMQGNKFIDQALSAARSSGYLPDQQQLAAAIAGARGELDPNLYATQFEADKAALVMAGKLSQLQELSGYQLTTAEQSLKIANDQLGALDSQLVYAKQQVDALNGIDVSVLSVAAAMSGLAVAMAAQKAGSTISTSAGGVAAGYAALSGAGSPSSAKNVVDSVAGLTAAQLSYYSAIVNKPGQGSVDEVLKYVSGLQDVQALASYESVSGIAHDPHESGDSIMARYGYSLLDSLSGDPKTRYSQVPGFASGGDFSGGLRIVGENGPELEATGPARIWNVGQTRAMLSGSSNNERLELLVEGLTTEVKRLQGIVSTGNIHASRTAAAVNGNPEQPMLVEVAQ